MTSQRPPTKLLVALFVTISLLSTSGSMRWMMQPAHSQTNAVFPENYFTYMYPQRPSSYYREKIAALPPCTQAGFPVECPFVPWLSLQYLALAFESYTGNSDRLALK